MKQAKGDMLHMDGDALVITTNGFTKSNGEAVMGRGIALQVARQLPWIPADLGKLLRTRGNRVHYVARNNDMALVSFPVKPVTCVNDGTNVVRHAASRYSLGDFVPGFHAKADIEIILNSAYELVNLTNQQGWQTVLLPRAGCGAGELQWETIEPLLGSVLDDRFVACTF